MRTIRQFVASDGTTRRYPSYVRPPSVQALRCHWPRPYDFLFMCPDIWHKDHYSDVLNPKQEQLGRTTPARPSSEGPGRAEAERRRRARSRRHRQLQGKDRR